MNLIESLKNEIGTSVINQISERTGITADQADSAVTTGIPAVLAGILKNSGSAGSLLGNIFPENESNIISDTHLDNEHETWLSKGRSALDSLFGNDSSAVAHAIGDKVGISPDKSTGVLAMVVPFITGAISKLMANKGWNISDFVSSIWENKSEIASALPSGLSSSLGLANLTTPHVDIPHVSATPLETPVVMPDNITLAEESRVESARPAQTRVVAEEKPSTSLMPWVIGIVVIALALWFFLGKGCNTEKVVGTVDSLKNHADTAMNVVKGKLNEAGDYIFDLGDTISKKLPDGKEIAIGSNSVENHLITFIEDKNKPVDKTTWFTFDRLYFETGKSILKPESQNQLENIAAILKAFPTVKLKLGGYTDNTGDAAVNKTISNERAQVALKALVALGVDGSRLDAEGYGAEHPVAGNDTAEGRAQNRRIDVRVTNK